MHAWVRACVHACVRLCMRACVHACVCMYMCTWLYRYIKVHTKCALFVGVGLVPVVDWLFFVVMTACN